MDWNKENKNYQNRKNSRPPYFFEEKKEGDEQVSPTPNFSQQDIKETVVETDQKKPFWTRFVQEKNQSENTDNPVVDLQYESDFEDPEAGIQLFEHSRSTLIRYLAPALVVLLISGYFSSPLTQVNSITVKGNQNISVEAIIEASQIKPLMSLNYVLDHARMYTTQIVNSSLQINEATLQKTDKGDLMIEIVENPKVAYVFLDGGYYPILASQAILNQPEQTPTNTLPMVTNFHDQEVLNTTIEQLALIDKPLLQTIETINYLDDTVNRNKIEITMRDGQHIFASLTDYGEKLNKYPEIKEIIGQQVGIINMEIATYFSPSDGSTNRQIDLTDK